MKNIRCLTPVANIHNPPTCGFAPPRGGDGGCRIEFQGVASLPLRQRIEGAGNAGAHRALR
jgi:hypothetical protein